MFLLSGAMTKASQPLRIYLLNVFSAEAISSGFSLLQEIVTSLTSSGLIGIALPPSHLKIG
jgi:hypothetical protein